MLINGGGVKKESEQFSWAIKGKKVYWIKFLSILNLAYIEFKIKQKGCPPWLPLACEKFSLQ